VPTYQYRCSECHHEFEEFQSMNDKPLKTCPVCGGKVERIISGGAGVIFKGSGFYITDHRSEKYLKDAAKDSTPKVTKTEKPGNTSKNTKS